MTAIWDNAAVQGSELLVLLALADWADDSGTCWPAMASLAGKARISERSAQRACRSLAERGLLAIEENAGPKGSNRYRVLAPANTTSGMGGDKLTPLNDAPEGVTPVAGGVTPVTLGGDTGVTRTVIEPPIEPSVEREGAAARDDDGSQGAQDVDPHPLADTRRSEALFWKAFKVWPRFDPSPKRPMLVAWAKVAPANREAAADAVPRYLAACKAEGMKHAPAIASYLDEELWRNYPPPPEGHAPAAPDVVSAPAFGPVWMAMRIKALLAGPEVTNVRLTAFEQGLVARGEADAETFLAERRRTHGWPTIRLMDERAAQGRGRSYRSGEVLPAHLCESVPVGSQTFAAWERLHGERGWPWIPDPGAMPVVYFPKGGPDGLEAFSEAVRLSATMENQEAAG